MEKLKKLIIPAISAIVGALLTIVVGVIFKDQPVDPTEAVAKINQGQNQIALVVANHEDGVAVTPKEVQTILEGGKLVTEGSLELGMMSEDPNFDACMSMTAVLCGFDGSIATLDGEGPWNINDENACALYQQDWTVKGCTFDATTDTGTNCESLKPSVWPPEDPSAWKDKAKQATDMGFTLAETAIISLAPTEGKDCVGGKYAYGSVCAGHDLADNVFDHAVEGEFKLDIPDAEFKLSGCTDVCPPVEPVDPIE
jgi:hypothetical protein